MIDRSEIMEAANETGLSLHVIEKDYVIGWVLAGIYDHPEIRQWVSLKPVGQGATTIVR